MVLALTTDPFRGGDNILVLCDTYDPEGNPLRRTRAPAVAKFEADSAAASRSIWSRSTATNLDGVTPLGRRRLPEAPGPLLLRRRRGQVLDARLRRALRAAAGLEVSGTNAEVMPGQWEYQIGPSVGIDAADQLAISRYILDRICEDLGVIVSIDPAHQRRLERRGLPQTSPPVEAPRPAASRPSRRCAKLGKKHQEHIAAYGGGNERRLTGDCGRPTSTPSLGRRRQRLLHPRAATRPPGRGYLEDRRPSSNVDPYVATALLFETSLGEVPGRTGTPRPLNDMTPACVRQNRLANKTRARETPW